MVPGEARVQEVVTPLLEMVTAMEAIGTRTITDIQGIMDHIGTVRLQKIVDLLGDEMIALIQGYRLDHRQPTLLGAGEIEAMDIDHFLASMKVPLQEIEPLLSHEVTWIPTYLVTGRTVDEEGEMIGPGMIGPIAVDAMTDEIEGLNTKNMVLLTQGVGVEVL